MFAIYNIPPHMLRSPYTNLLIYLIKIIYSVPFEIRGMSGIVNQMQQHHVNK